MFDKIQHIGYLVADLDKAVMWFKHGFGAENAGGGPVQSSRAVPSGGGDGFVHFGQGGGGLISPRGPSPPPQATPLIHTLLSVLGGSRPAGGPAIAQR